MQCRRIERVQSQLPRPQTSPARPGHSPAEHQPLNLMMSERSHRHNPAAHSRSRPTRAEKGRFLSNSSAISNCEPHDLICLHASAAVGPWIAGSRRLPLFPRKEGQTRAELFHRKKLSACRFSPQGHCVRAPCPNKRRKDCVCHRVSNNEDTDPHTS